MEVPDFDASAGDKLDLLRGWLLLHHKGKRREHDIAAPFHRPLVPVAAQCRCPLVVDVEKVDNSCIKKNCSMHDVKAAGVDADAWSCQNIFPRLGRVLTRRVSEELGSSVGTDRGELPALSDISTAQVRISAGLTTPRHKTQAANSPVAISKTSFKRRLGSGRPTDPNECREDRVT